MKERATKLFKGSAKIAGKAFKKALGVTVPPEILGSSSFFGGLNRLGDAMESLGAESEGGKTGREYVARKSGGVVADTAVGMLLFGVPVTMVTSLFSDGCKVVSQVFKGARTDDEEYTRMGEFFGDMSTISNDFNVLFDVPSREGARRVRGSIDALADRLRREGRLSERMEGDLMELRRMCEEVREGGRKERERLTGKVHEKLAEIAEEELSGSRLSVYKKDVVEFLKRPTVPNIRGMHDRLLANFRKRGVSVRDRSLRFAGKLVDSLESFSSEDFREELRHLMAKGYGAREELGDRAYQGYRLAHSLFRTTYKGASLFGRHYRKQIKGVIGREPRRPARR